MRIMISAGFILAAAPLLVAQNQDQLFLFDKGGFQFISTQMISGPAVKGAPYSAEAVTETIQTLPDGNRIVNRLSSMQYRDSEGR